MTKEREDEIRKAVQAHNERYPNCMNPRCHYLEDCLQEIERLRRDPNE